MTSSRCCGPFMVRKQLEMYRPNGFTHGDTSRSHATRGTNGMGRQRFSRSQVRVLPGALHCSSAATQPPRYEVTLTRWSENGPFTRAHHALARAYRRPHSRLTRPTSWIVARLICYPTIAAAAVVALVGARDPGIFTDIMVDGERVRVTR